MRPLPTHDHDTRAGQRGRRTARHLVVLVVALLTTGVAAPAASAAGPAEAVAIDATVDFASGMGSFTATGGGLCASGTTSDEGTGVAGNGRAVTFHLFKTFTCDDGSGSFTLRLQASTRFCEPHTIGGWTVAGGTGAYEGLRGGGHVVGTYDTGDACTATAVDDAFTGRVVG